MRRVEVKDYQPNWQENFNNEAKKLKTIFNDEIIGSVAKLKIM